MSQDLAFWNVVPAKFQAWLCRYMMDNHNMRPKETLEKACKSLQNYKTSHKDEEAKKKRDLKTKKRRKPGDKTGPASEAGSQESQVSVDDELFLRLETDSDEGQAVEGEGTAPEPEDVEQAGAGAAQAEGEEALGGEEESPEPSTSTGKGKRSKGQVTKGPAKKPRTDN